MQLQSEKNIVTVCCMVTIEGESLSPGGSMTGGAFKNNSNLLGRRREIEELERSVGILRKELEKRRNNR